MTLFFHTNKRIRAREHGKKWTLMLLWPSACFLMTILYPVERALAFDGRFQRSDFKAIIAIDPGHGGHDFGVMGSTGIKEKEVVFQLALELKKVLERNYTVLLTRDGDYSVDLENRTALGNYRGARLFISLHTGGGFHATNHGISTFYHGNSALLKPKKKRFETSVPFPWYEIQRAHKKESQRLGKLVQDQLIKDLNVPNGGIHEAPLYVLQGADCPAILVETGFLSNPADEARLNNKDIVSQTATAIAAGIDMYVNAR